MEGLIHGEAYFRNFTVLLETKIKNDEHVAFLKRNILYRLISISVHVFSYIVNVIGD